MRWGVSTVLAVLALLVVPSGASAYPEFRCQGPEACARASADGSRVVFDTRDRLLPADDANSNDVYELVNGKTLRLLTPDLRDDPYPKPSSVVKGISRDGERVVIETQHPYSPLDQDEYQDMYVLEDGVWTLVTFSPGHEWFPFLDMSADARHIYFNPGRTPLVSSDLDNDEDIYEWSRQYGVKMVSTGPTENITPMPSYAGLGIGFGGVTDDGSRVFFETGDALTAEAQAGGDTHEGNLYLRDGGSTTTYLPVPGTMPANWTPRTAAAGLSPDGSRVYVDTSLQIGDDDELGYDVYVRTPDGAFTLISTGPAGGDGTGPGCDPADLADCSAFYVGSSRSGDRVFFTTEERLTSDDVDLTNDIYERHGSTTTLVTPNTPDPPAPMGRVWAPDFQGASADGTQVAFTTRSPLVPADKDARLDVYVRADGQYHLISTGPLGDNSKFEPRFADFTEGGNNVVFFTKARLLASDNDNDVDVYQRILFNPAPRRAVAAGKRKKKVRAAGRTKLISAERVPPAIKIARRGRISGGKASVRIGCPKKESSGGCKGTVKVRGGGSGRFKIKRGRSTWVRVGSAASVGDSATVTVKGKDLFGNKARVRKRVRF